MLKSWWNLGRIPMTPPFHSLKELLQWCYSPRTYLTKSNSLLKISKKIRSQSEKKFSLEKLYLELWGNSSTIYCHSWVQRWYYFSLISLTLIETRCQTASYTFLSIISCRNSSQIRLHPWMPSKNLFFCFPQKLSSISTLCLR